jgi:hypothetical protein
VIAYSFYVNEFNALQPEPPVRPPAARESSPTMDPDEVEIKKFFFHFLIPYLSL